MTAAPLPAPLPACPFCGSDGEALRVLPPTCTPKSPYNPADRSYPVLRCGGCGASVPGEDWDTLGASAIAAWNRRAPEAQAWRAIDADTPRDRPIVAWCDRKADPYHVTGPNGEAWITTFARHEDWLGSGPEGLQVVEWGGEYDQGDDLIPDWWFVAGSDFEKPVYPTHWLPAETPPGATPAAPPADPDDLCSYCGAPAPGDEHWRYCPQTRPAAPPAREAALVEALVPFARMAGRMLACRQIVRAVPDTLPDDLGGEIITLVDDPAIGGDDRRSVTLRREHFMAARDAIPERWR